MWRFLRNFVFWIFFEKKSVALKVFYLTTNLFFKNKFFFVEQKKINSKKNVEIFKKFRVFDFFSKKIRRTRRLFSIDEFIV